jgi:hypothetical protein
MNHLHARTSFPGQTRSSLVKPGQTIFMNLDHLHHSISPSLHHSITPPLHHSTTPLGVRLFRVFRGSNHPQSSVVFTDFHLISLNFT